MMFKPQTLTNHYLYDLKNYLAMSVPAPRPGFIGICLTDLSPTGVVKIGEHLHDAKAIFGFIKKSSRVKVIRIEINLLIVEEVLPQEGEG